MGLLDRLKRPSQHDEGSIRQMLEGSGATAEQAEEIVQILGHKLSPDRMHVWLSHPKKSHGVPDPASDERFGVVLKWTPLNAVSAGKTQLVIDEARRYAGAAGRDPA